MGLLNRMNPFKARQPGGKPKKPPAAQANPPTNTPTAPPPTTPPTPPSGLNRVQSGNISLVTKTPEESLLQVEAESEEVVFGESSQHKIMANTNQNWALIGPLLFAVATIMEIFLVLWSYMKDHNVFYAATLLAVSVIAEATLVTVSFAAHMLRSRAAKRPTGMTREERDELGQIKWIWWLLSLFIATTQVFFIVTQSDTTKADPTTLIAIAIVRALASMVADYYTAYIAREKPNDAEKALEIKAQKTEFAEKTLEGESKKIAVINAGSVKVQEAAQAARINQARTEQKAAMELDLLRTQQELARLENENRIAKAKAQYESEAEWSNLQIAYMRQSQARLAEAAKSLDGASAKDKEITSTLHYVISEIKELKGQLESSGGRATTGPLRVVNGHQEDD
jgi:hypothetical protein